MTTRNFLVDTYFSFLFWTAFTGLGVCVWYFPLWSMGLSGYEALLFTNLFSSILGISSILSFLSSSKKISSLLLLPGLFAYMFPDPVVRFSIVGVSFGLACIWLGTKLIPDSPITRGRLAAEINVLLSGLILSLIVRMACFTNNPFWPIMNEYNGGWNRLGLFLAIVSYASIFLRKSSVPELDSKHKKPLIETPSSKAFNRAWFVAALGLGAWIFLVNSIFTETSTLGRWTWDGFPNTGPKPVPWSALVLTAMTIGCSIGNNFGFTTSLVWWCAASAGAYSITFISGWSSFLLGLILGAYATSIAPALLTLVSKCPKGRTLFTAFMFYNILVFAHVYVVAYEFVPGGFLLRERTWVVMTMTMLPLFSASRLARKLVLKSNSASSKAPQINNSEVFENKGTSRGIMWFMVVIGWIIMYWRTPTAAQTPKPFHPEERLLTSAIWTIHFDIDNDMWSAEHKILEAVRDLEPDVIGFLESDTERIIMGSRDWTQYVAEKLNYYVDYGPSPRKHTWGCAMLSKFPIKRSSHHLLPSPVGELACAIYATLDVHGRDVDVVISHNGQEENLLDRQLQTTELARIIKNSNNPIVFTGYVVTKPFGEIYDILINGGQIHDVDESDDDRWCQYIAYRGLKRIGYARISRGTITDTEIQAAKFVVPKPQEDISAWKPSSVRVQESDYSPAHHFPTIFRGKGVREHFYHVFSEPRYYD
ncbi:hypothetical protein BB560_006881 [Smittium megazygosporum]|uniref:Endonuclease/exonuclease/phosphatase domain-containing protein n=1 Tax=Smittium megazygosporum TaxID=133381 RepID=A0A2T9Y0I5_9FUNG|nr:hypothetical protein BB560_006881 [Smittium megazygosporum]